MSRDIHNLIVHHSDSKWGDGKVIEQWHMAPKPKGNGWDRPGYCVVIQNGFPTYNSLSENESVEGSDGLVERIYTEDKKTYGCKYANEDSLHVCLIGNFDVQEPTQLQIDALIRLLVFWCKKYKLKSSDVYGHGEMQRKIGKEGYSKTCPGKNVDMDQVREAVKAQVGE